MAKVGEEKKTLDRVSEEQKGLKERKGKVRVRVVLWGLGAIEGDKKGCGEGQCRENASENRIAKKLKLGFYAGFRRSFATSAIRVLRNHSLLPTPSNQCVSSVCVIWGWDCFLSSFSTVHCVLRIYWHASLIYWYDSFILAGVSDITKMPREWE